MTKKVTATELALKADYSRKDKREEAQRGEEKDDVQVPVSDVT